MKRKIIETGDGSHTISVPELDEHYHSVNGAINEAYHVYLNAGFEYFDLEKLSVLEIGFGTGLNSIITLIEAIKQSKDVYYQSIEAFPVEREDIEKLNYGDLLEDSNFKDLFLKVHDAEWGKETLISDNFTLLKQHKKFQDVDDVNKFDVIYFDAFGPQAQPELWTEEIFQKMFRALKNEGVLVTYSAKGSVKRALKSVGFIIENIPGPKGKREMTRAIKK